MAFEQLSFEDSIANQIRSHSSTIRRYLATSMAAHNRPGESVYHLAASLGDTVDALGNAAPDSAKVARERRKFWEFIDQHGLGEGRIGD